MLVSPPSCVRYATRLPSGEMAQSKKTRPSENSLRLAIRRSEPSTRLRSPDLRRAAPVGRISEAGAVGRPTWRDFCARCGDHVPGRQTGEGHLDDVISNLSTRECQCSAVGRERWVKVLGSAGRNGPCRLRRKVDEQEMTARASRAKRSLNCSPETLIATTRSSRLSRAFHTSPMPPA
jgi:hypothetical protein